MTRTTINPHTPSDGNSSANNIVENEATAAADKSMPPSMTTPVCASASSSMGLDSRISTVRL
jgi:hypothetical protein